MVVVGAATLAGGLTYAATRSGAGIDSSPPKGAIDATVTQANIRQTICVSGYTATVRPSSSYTSALKLQQLRERHLSGSPSSYEEDHLVSLELGGDPRSPDNLWPEPWNGPHNARDKDRVENAAHKAVCDGTLTLADAQRKIARDWQALGRELGVP